jgi:hypothetical protein
MPFVYPHGMDLPDIFGFLETDRFAAEDPENHSWISLDFLGFSRPNLDFSIGYEDFSGSFF